MQASHYCALHLHVQQNVTIFHNLAKSKHKLQQSISTTILFPNQRIGGSQYYSLFTVQEAGKYHEMR